MGQNSAKYYGAHYGAHSDAESGLHEDGDFTENDEVIARSLQEELSQVAVAQASGSSHTTEEELQESVSAQNWLASFTTRKYTSDDFSTLDGEVCRRLNQMNPVPHVPKINGDLPSVDEEISDHQRLLDRLRLYNLVELKVQGDGNCQFRALSDQLYRTPQHHMFVREQVLHQLKSHPENYEGYVPMLYDQYLMKMAKSGEWGDHVTLQAAADSAVQPLNFQDLAKFFQILATLRFFLSAERSTRVICLSFWAEVHYNSIYPEGVTRS